MQKMSVPAPAEIAAPTMSADTVHDLMNRRREAVKNRLRYHLTETDCVLICTHGTDRYYHHGQVIAQEGDPIKTVYRIKTGRICLQKQGQKLYNLTMGFFIGEGLFIHHEDDYNDFFGATLVANGPVTLTEVSIPFVRQILEADKVLAFKMYRHIAGKLSALLLSVLGSVGVEEDVVSSPRSDHSSPSSPSSVRSDSQGTLASSVSSNSLASSSDFAVRSSASMPDLHAPPKSVIMTEEMVEEATHRPIRKKLHRLTGKLKEKTPFKVYQLGGNHHMPVTCQLTSQKIIIITGSGIKAKRKIKYNKILDIRQTGHNTATIIHGVQARTLFFTNEEDLNEFFGIVTSLISEENKQIFSNVIAPFTTSPPPNHTPPVTSPPPESPEVQAAHDKAVIQRLATQQDLVKGDLIVSEGDLYQRIYTVVQGEVHMKRKGHHLVTLRDGDVFGVLTLFYLRPSMMDIEVASDTATLLIIPGYRVNELITSNFPLAVRMHKKAAQLIYTQVGQLLKSQEQVVEKFSDASFIA